MADRFQTQCPHCGVKFQITAQQLQLANGTVRCGSCLQVFQANQNLVPLASTPPAGVGSARGTSKPAAPPADAQATVQRPAITVPPRPAAPAKPAAQPPRPNIPPAVDDDLADMILRELDEPAPARPAARPPAAAKPPAAAGPAWAPPPPAGAKAPPATPQATPGWGAPPPPKPAAKPAAPPPAPASNAARYGIEENKTRISIGGELDERLIDDQDPFGISSAATTMEDKDFHPEADESWAKALLGEGPKDERDERVRKFQISADELSIVDTTGVQKKSGLAERMERLAGGAPRGRGNDMPAPIKRTAPAGGSQVDDELDFLADPGLTLQDVELPDLDSNDDLVTAAQAHQVSWGGDVFWGTLSAVFLLVLLGQYLAFNKDTLARDPAWRGIYEVACGAIGCTLPGDSAVGRIQGANLVIRSHPSLANALMVDAVVYNRAPFAQPFPRLELGFTDAAGKPVAGRVFAPEEYLKGELAGAASMPPDTPIHLSLELLDPGPAAINYELRFLPPDAS